MKSSSESDILLSVYKASWLPGTGQQVSLQAPEAEFLMQTTWHKVIFLAVEGVWLKGGNSTTITWLK